MLVGILLVVSLPVGLVANTLTSNGGKVWYLAEGYTGGGFSTYILVQNPSANTATVDVTYMLQGGGTVVRQHTVAGKSRYTIVTGDQVGADQAFSTKLVSDQDIIVERAMYFPDGGGHNTVAVSADALAVSTPTSTPTPESVMISGRFKLDSTKINTEFTGPITICQDLDSLLVDVEGRGGGYGATFSDNGSWLGIKGAAICIGQLTSLNTAGLSAMQKWMRGALARDGFGLVVEVDLTRLPNASLESCSFIVVTQHSSTVLTFRQIGVSGTSGFLSALMGGTIPDQNGVYHLQGVCAN